MIFVPDYRLFWVIITFHKVVWGRLGSGDIIFVSRLPLSPLVKECRKYVYIIMGKL